MRLKFGKSSKRSSASAASQDKDINPLSLSAAPESIHEDCIEASTVTSALTYSPTSKTKSTKFEASSPSTTTSIMTPKSTCHQSSSDKVEDRKKNLKKRFSRKIKKKKNPKGQDVDGERVVMGDEYAIVTVQPKGFPPHYRSDDANNNTHDSSILWQSARTTTPTSTSSHPNPQPQQRDQEATGSNNSNNNLAQSNELKKQRFSMVRMLSARRSPRHERKDNQVEVEEPVLSVEDTNEGYELPTSTSMPQKKKKFSFRRSKSIKQ